MQGDVSLQSAFGFPCFTSGNNHLGNIMNSQNICMKQQFTSRKHMPVLNLTITGYHYGAMVRLDETGRKTDMSD